MGSDRRKGDPKNEAHTAFTWEVKANDWGYYKQFKQKSCLCWHRDKYKTNVIHTAKYNVFSFLPLNLYEQFRRVSNLYFLLIIVLQGIPEISTLPWFSLFAPLVCLLVIRASRDLMDDIGRHRSDKAINNRPCQILTGKRFSWRKWKDLCVGDVVCLSKDSIVPADLLLLASTEPSSLCYVETVDIDGETNLKFRQALPVTHNELTSTRKMAAFQGTVLCEEPNSRMHQFVGVLEWNGQRHPLDVGNLLLRGCRVRNTDTCYGLVIYAGFDTKIMKNCGKIHLKRTKLDLLMNRLVVLIFLSLVVVSVTLALGFSLKVRDFREKHYYLWAMHTRGLFLETFFNFWSFLILLSVMVPMAMFILAEFIYLGNSIFINWDMQMYHAPQDMPAKARSTSLNDQLGQVQYIFSDKTGTLTQNTMIFKKCCIAGRIYGPETKSGTSAQEKPHGWKYPFHNEELLGLVQEGRDPAVREFWRLLAICHTVMVHQKDNQLVYQAASPDEEALVHAARSFGFVFLSRTQDSVTLLELGEARVYQVLAMMDFNSVRKRMSVLVRNPEGSIRLYTKGADTVILERLHKRGDVEMATEEVLLTFAKETLRTLCLAYKEVGEEAYQKWQVQHQQACLLLENRAQALQDAYEQMEQKLELLGVTAIEDRLQDGVPDTIRCLRRGNIKIWVLTGDKQETAVNIGFACQLLSENMLILEEREINHVLETYWETNNNKQTNKGYLKFTSQVKLAMVINGDFLDKLLLSLRKEPRALVQNVVVDENSPESNQLRRDFLQARRMSLMRHSFGPSLVPAQSSTTKTQESPEVRRERAFVDLATRCQTVICCRVTPKQKALVVALVKKYHQVVTLAIGDGANDVNMIKTADIGVGLTGQEGMQAVQNSDYALAQFSFLQRLLLVHGRWSYMRVCKFLRYFFYKTVASMMVQIWFSFYNGFTAQPLYEGWFLALFNLLYTTMPVLYIGLFEQDVTAAESLLMPELYVAGQEDKLFNYWVFFQAVAHGTATSLVNFFVTLWVGHNSVGPSSFSDYQSFAVIVAVSSLLSITLEVILIIRYWTVLCLLTILLSLGSYVVMTHATQSLWLWKMAPKTFPFLFADRNVLAHPSNLLVILLNVSLNTLPVLAFRVIYKTLRKPCLKQEEEMPSEDVAVVEPVPYLRREPPTRRSSYAFSHREGYADLITQGTILRPSPRSNEEACESPAPSDDELSPSSKESRSHAWKVSVLKRSSHQHQGRASSEDTQHYTTGSSSCAVAGPAASGSDSRSTLTRKPRSPTSRPPGSTQESRSFPETPSQFFTAPSWPSDRTSESQSESLEGRPSWTPFRKSWPNAWQKEAHPAKEETAPLPSKTHASPAETLPPTAEESSLSEQPMEVEPWEVDRQPSPMEWLPADAAEPPSPAPSGPFAAPQRPSS
ncbi:phospholipid-transporting ATPase IK [Sciurus carolinensis]|uniref:phospholipid-transporting ATPase IK n=1 Tax=Sciurus carolinensis TaxID=30640 RepID=UPI001FB30402|nr:phospholipid-transporting ATPase IK [Sciurus carolinensis]